MSEIRMNARELASLINNYEFKIYELEKEIENFKAIREEDLEAMYQEELQKRKDAYYSGNGTNDI